MKNSFEKLPQEEQENQKTGVVKIEKKGAIAGPKFILTTNKENFCREEQLSRISEKGDLFKKEWECGCYNDSDGKTTLCDKHEQIPPIERRDIIITKKSSDGKWLESVEVSTSYMELLRGKIAESLEKNKGNWEKIWDVAGILGVERE